MGEAAFRTSVVFPCLNERHGVGKCVEDALAAFAEAGLPCEVIVADNGSTDGSQEIASAAGARVISVPRRGYGSAVNAGISAAGGDVVLWSDADGTYPLRDGPALARAAWQTGNVVLGSRFGGVMHAGAMPVLHRVLGNPLQRFLMRIFLGVRSSDPHSGMRAVKREIFELVRPDSVGWEFTFEMLLNATRRHVPVSELPIDYHPRLGESKLRALPEGWAFLRFMILRSPTYLFVLPGLMSFLLGVGLLLWLAPADRPFGPATLGINTLLVAALLTSAGYQLMALGLCAQIYVSDVQPGASARWAQPILKRFTLERGIATGLLVGIAGVGVVGWLGARWIAGDFGVISRAGHGLALIGLSVAFIGLETIFSSFFLALLLSLVTPNDSEA